jgi:predicted lipoprotein with Yx(FWY)xxD motif
MTPNTMNGMGAMSRIAALAAVGILALAACSASGASSGSGAVAGTTSAPAATTATDDYGRATTPSEAPAASAEAAGDAYAVAAAKDAAAGPYLTGEDGKTLYVFTKDTGSTSVCYDQCAVNWPPFVLEGSESVKAGDGVTGTFATTKRTDGAMQVTYNGAPLYYYVADTKAGDVTGQGVGGVWFVAAP